MAGFPLSLDDAVARARGLVLARYAEPRAAWLGGSVVRGDATDRSDLDITVLVDSSPAPMRDSFVAQGIPVELFVHNESSLREFCDNDIARRQPSMLRLVAETVVLLDRDGSGRRLRSAYLKELAEGPAPMSRNEIDRLRYGLTDLLADYDGLDGSPTLTWEYFPTHLFDRSMQLLLAHENAWGGSGKGLIEAVTAWAHTVPEESDWRQLPARWQQALVARDRDGIRRLVNEVLQRCGGPLWDGYRVTR